MFAKLPILVGLLVASGALAEDLELITAELDGNRIITTMNSDNYAITGPNLPDNWQAVSINGNNIMVVPEQGGNWWFHKDDVENEMQIVYNMKSKFDAILADEKNRHKFPTQSLSDTNFDFSVRKDDLPNNWVQLIVEGDLYITLSKNGEIRVRCRRAMRWGDLYKLKSIRKQLVLNST